MLKTILERLSLVGEYFGYVTDRVIRERFFSAKKPFSHESFF